MLDADHYSSNLGGSFEGRIYRSYDRHIERFGSYGYYETASNHADAAYSTSQTSYTTNQGFYSTVSAHLTSSDPNQRTFQSTMSSQPNHHNIFSSQNANLMSSQRLSPVQLSGPSLTSAASYSRPVRVVHQHAIPVLSQRVSHAPSIQLLERRSVLGVQEVPRISVMSPPAEIRGVRRWLDLKVGIKFGERVDFGTGKMFVFVKRLVAGGPAHLSGQIQLGDVLVQIDGQDVQGLGLAHIKHKIPGPRNSWVTLGFQGQNGKLREVTLPRTAYGNDSQQQMPPAAPAPSQPYQHQPSSNLRPQNFQPMPGHGYLGNEPQQAPQRNLVYMTQPQAVDGTTAHLPGAMQLRPLGSVPGASSPSVESPPWIYESEPVMMHPTITAGQMGSNHPRHEWKYAQDNYPVVIEKDSDDIYSVQV
ncbi:hypothetical protein GUITHDRAFT_144119 [Guillardia theta CCMP2712]|uniref:PDZ domain-containing protein n=1 Tax=Guillardia theta (strain CCMP2712) TaxID=905079 RepID=L1IRH9_GUITC|nr:hypothetical protein GUITHDRAFT_144119 [Guillardia theta CCMP2712]EKX38509.1 hypothetical protein GUITHDRAFT_144119 [Guillardia theta CCMP2712]|eukprot:XP_005825489.1 hypothetical protein GUITHDRAFT_144119 [Guillardia theta CCMP2712]